MWDRTVKHFQLGRRVINMHPVPTIYPSYSHSDIDECSSENECHLDATCTNTKGSYNCTCKDGFEGDGKNCTGNHKELTQEELRERKLFLSWLSKLPRSIETQALYLYYYLPFSFFLQTLTNALLKTTVIWMPLVTTPKDLTTALVKMDLKATGEITARVRFILKA